MYDDLSAPDMYYNLSPPDKYDDLSAPGLYDKGLHSVPDCQGGHWLLHPVQDHLGRMVIGHWTLRIRSLLVIDSSGLGHSRNQVTLRGMSLTG